MTSEDRVLIEFRRVSVARGQTRVLHEIDLRILQREHVAILGPNGSGKSTLVKSITGECYPLLDPGASLTILGRSSWDIFELRSLLGIVSSDFVDICSDGCLGRDLVLSGFFSSTGLWQQRGQVTAAMGARAEEVMGQLEVSHLADRAVAEMSSGEARRIVIARALVHDPLALVLDEPGTSLDLLAQQELRDTLRRLASAGVGVILVTHHLGDIIPEIERVVMMKAGRIVADGPKDRMLTESSLSELFGVKVTLARRGDFYHAW